MDTVTGRYYSHVIASDVAINWHDTFDSLLYHTPVPGFGAVTGSFSSPTGSVSSWTTNSDYYGSVQLRAYKTVCSPTLSQTATGTQSQIVTPSQTASITSTASTTQSSTQSRSPTQSNTLRLSLPLSAKPYPSPRRLLLQQRRRRRRA